MSILNIPSMFKSPKIRRFDFKTRYYDERKERLEMIKKGGINQIKFNRSRRISFDKKRMIRLILITSVLFFITLLILKKYYQPHNFLLKTFLQFPLLL